MLKKLIAILLFCSVCFASQAQGQQEGDNSWQQRKQQFKADKIAYISTNMNFTVEEAQRFWPIYNKYDELFDKIASKRRANFEPKCINAGIDKLTNDQCQQMLSTSFKIDEEELAIRKKLYEELSSLFSQTVIMKYYHVEHEFRRKVLSDCKQNNSASFGKSFKNN